MNYVLPRASLWFLIVATSNQMNLMVPYFDLKKNIMQWKLYMSETSGCSAAGISLHCIFTLTGVTLLIRACMCILLLVQGPNAKFCIYNDEIACRMLLQVKWRSIICCALCFLKISNWDPSWSEKLCSTPLGFNRRRGKTTQSPGSVCSAPRRSLEIGLCISIHWFD